MYNGIQYNTENDDRPELQQQPPLIELCYDCNKIVNHCPECGYSLHRRENDIREFGLSLKYAMNGLEKTKCYQDISQGQVVLDGLAERFEMLFGYNPIKSL